MEDSLSPGISLIGRRVESEDDASRKLTVATRRSRPEEPAGVVNDDPGHGITSVVASGKAVENRLDPRGGAQLAGWCKSKHGSLRESASTICSSVKGAALIERQTAGRQSSIRTAKRKYDCFC